MTGKRSLGWIAGIVLVLACGDVALAQYHSGVGRFLQRDPIGYAGGSMNVYESVKSNPAAGVDPSGMRPPAVGALGHTKHEFEVWATVNWFNRKLKEYTHSFTDNRIDEYWEVEHKLVFYCTKNGDAVNADAKPPVKKWQGVWTSTRYYRNDGKAPKLLGSKVFDAKKDGTWSAMEVGQAPPREGECANGRKGILFSVGGVAQDFNRRGQWQVTAGLSLKLSEFLGLSVGGGYTKPDNKTQPEGNTAEYYMTWLVCCCSDGKTPNKWMAYEHDKLEAKANTTKGILGHHEMGFMTPLVGTVQYHGE